MKTVLILALGEIREGLRNRWVAASIVLLATLAFALSALGSAPMGTVNANALAVSVASLSSLSVYLLPLIALMLSFPALVGELVAAPDARVVQEHGAIAVEAGERVDQPPGVAPGVGAAITDEDPWADEAEALEPVPDSHTLQLYADSLRG